MNAETLKKIRAAVRREAGSMLAPEDRWDLSQDIALRLSQLKEPPENEDGWIKIAAFYKVSNFLERQRVEREALAHVKSVSPTPRYKQSLLRDPLVNYMAVKASKRCSGKNEVEDALIACIDARARRRKKFVSIVRKPAEIAGNWRNIFSKKAQINVIRQIYTHGKSDRGHPPLCQEPNRPDPDQTL